MSAGHCSSGGTSGDHRFVRVHWIDRVEPLGRRCGWATCCVLDQCVFRLGSPRDHVEPDYDAYESRYNDSEGLAVGCCRELIQREQPEQPTRHDCCGRQFHLHGRIQSDGDGCRDRATDRNEQCRSGDFDCGQFERRGRSRPQRAELFRQCGDRCGNRELHGDTERASKQRRIASESCKQQ